MCHQLIYYKSFWYNYEAFILILIKRIYDIFTMIWIWPVANLSQSFIELNLRRYTILARESWAHAIVNTQVKVFQLNICFRENGPHLHQNLWNQNSHQEGKNSRTIWIPLKIPGENSGKSSKNPHHQSLNHTQSSIRKRFRFHTLWRNEDEYDLTTHLFVTIFRRFRFQDYLNPSMFMEGVGCWMGMLEE